jgi:hypothetical protein
MIDGVAQSLKYFVALHPSSLRRTYCTPHSSGFVRLVFGPLCLAIPFTISYAATKKQQSFSAVSLRGAWQITYKGTFVNITAF